MSSDQAGDLDRSLLLQVDEIGDRFEAAWRSGSAPQIEDFLQDLPGDTQYELLLALIELDIHFRSQAGAAPDLEHYAARFPDCAPLIRQKLHSSHGKTMVPQHGDPVDSDEAEGTQSVRQSSSSSRRVGPFKVLEKLGEGGMGEVYVADQLEPVKRRVALKLIRSGLDHAQTIARFEAERQALAMMDHPHIARVLDAGITPEGQPYFAMELVRGISITKYCDRNRLGIPERLGLFVQVCRAIQHAHQKGILHRDLKPSNVLVTQRDGVPLAKVIDFGLAKALQSEQRLTEKTLYTQMGQAMGTLEYMSPEQAEMNELGVDTRTDVYSLGVLFYELLTGSTPLGHDRVCREAYHRLLELICSEETPAPSRRLSDSGAEIAGISAQRQIDPHRLSGVLKGELDWIALKALSKERDRRYDGAGNLADDVQHFLDGEVVTARPPTAGYRLRKSIRRNKAAFVSGLVLVVSLLLGLIGTGTMWRRAQREAGRANTAESQATQQAATARAAETTARAAEATAQVQAVKARTAETHAVAARETAERNLSAAEKNAYIFDMLLAQRDWEDAQIGHLKERLNRHRDRADLKGFEWDYWNRLTQRGLSTFNGHSMSVNSVRFSRDGKWVVSGAGQKMESGEIKLWDVESGREMFVLKGQTNNVRCVDLSPNARWIVSGSNAGILQIWDVASGQELRTLEGHKGLALSVDFSPDGKRIVSGSFDKTAKVWDAETGQELQTLTCQYWVYGVVFSPNGKRIATASADRTVRVWDTESGRQLLMLNGHTLAVNCVDFSPDGKRIVSGGADKALKVWDAVTGRQLLTRTAHTQPVTSVSFSPDGKQIVSGSLDNTLKVWDVASGQVTLTLKGHSGWVHSAGFSPDGKRIVSGSQDTTLMLWDLATGPEILSLNRYLEPDVGLSFCARFSPDGKRIVSGDENTVKVWDAVTGLETLTIKGHSDRVSSVSFSPDGTRILSSSAPNFQLPVRNDRTLKVWNAATGQESLIISGHSKAVYSASFSRDGKWIVSGSVDKTLKLWDATTGQEKLTFTGHSKPVTCADFSPDGKRIVSGGWEKTLKVWDTDTGQETLTLEGHTGAITDVSFSPNGKWIVSGSEDKTLKLWDAATGRATRTLKGHTKNVSDVGFSSDGKRIVSSSADTTMKLWDVATGQETLTLKGHSGTINHASFSSDGNRILSGSAADRTLNVWDARPWTMQQRVARQAADVVRGAWQKDLTKDAVLQRIRTDPGLDQAIRQKAVQLVESLNGPTAAEFNNVSWRTVRQRRSTPGSYRQALKQVQAAMALEPNNVMFRNTLGVALYRSGDYEGAVSTLTQNEIYIRTLGRESPVDSVFLAMALFRIGKIEAAQKRMEQLRTVAKQPQWASNAEFLGFLREAEGLDDTGEQKRDRSQ